MRQTHIGGEKVFVDFAGDTIDIFDPNTGEAHAMKLFVAAMGASNYTYAEACSSESLPDWIALHTNLSRLAQRGELEAGRETYGVALGCFATSAMRTSTEFTDKSIGGGIQMAVDLDVIVGRDAAPLPARKDVWLVRQFRQLETIDLGEEFGAAEPNPRIWRALSSTTSTPMAALSSAREKNRCLRRRANTQRCTIWTADLNLCLVLRASWSGCEDRGSRNGSPSRRRFG